MSSGCCEIVEKIDKELGKVIKNNELPTIDKKVKSIKFINEIIVENKSEIPPLYRYSALTMNDIVNIKNYGLIHLVKATKMNDLFEGAVCDKNGGSTIKKIQEFQENIYLKCFSQKNDNILMWSMYGDNSKGICVEYDFSSLQNESEILKMLYPVRYNEKRFVSENSSDLQNNIYLFIRKSTDWEYEKEWRLIFKGNVRDRKSLQKKITNKLGKNFLNEQNAFACPDTFPITTNCVKGIYFGSRVSTKTIETVKDCLSSDIKYYKMFLHHTEYKLTSNNV